MQTAIGLLYWWEVLEVKQIRSFAVWFTYSNQNWNCNREMVGYQNYFLSIKIPCEQNKNKSVLNRVNVELCAI